MLKWAVTQRRETTEAKCEVSRPLANGAAVKRRESAPCKIIKQRESVSRCSKTKRRRSSTGKKSVYCDDEKENQYTSTPIKSSEGEALRDIINLTPKEKRLTLFSKQEITDDPAYKEFADGRFKHKRKKRCLDPAHSKDALVNSDDDGSQFFKPFEAVDSHVRSLLVDNTNHHKCIKTKTPHQDIKKLLPQTYAPTLPTYFMEYSPLTETKVLPPSICCTVPRLKSTLDEQFPPNKKAKIEHVNDFLHQISHVTALERSDSQNVSTETIKGSEIKVSPLVQRLVDLRFNKNGCDKRREGINDSSFINELSLDQLVDAILDSSTEFETKTIEEVKAPQEPEKSESNGRVPPQDGNGSIDSGFRSNSTENSHHIDSNYVCKCKTNTAKNISSERTVINLEEAYNERCIDDVTVRKRSLSNSPGCSSQPKRPFLENSTENINFTLKRQRCVRRRKNTSVEKVKRVLVHDKTETVKPSLPEVVECNNSFEISGESVLVCESDMVSSLDNNSSDSKTVTENFRRIRRCLNFESPNSSLMQFARSSTPKTEDKIKGIVHLKLFYANGELVLQGKSSGACCT